MSKVCVIEGADELSAKLAALSAAARGKAMMDALTAGARELAGDTKKRLVAKMGPGATRRGLRGRKGQSNHTPMTEGVNVIRDAAYSTAIVSIMRDFRLKWFEKGTAQRFAGGRRKDGFYPGQGNASNNRGSIRALHFFRDARSQEETILKTVFGSLDQSLAKILK